VAGAARLVRIAWLPLRRVAEGRDHMLITLYSGTQDLCAGLGVRQGADHIESHRLVPATYSDTAVDARWLSPSFDVAVRAVAPSSLAPARTRRTSTPVLRVDRRRGRRRPGLVLAFGVVGSPDTLQSRRAPTDWPTCVPAASRCMVEASGK